MVCPLCTSTESCELIFAFLPQPITGGCQCCLVIVALFIPPLAVAFATSPACNSATYLCVSFSPPLMELEFDLVLGFSTFPSGVSPFMVAPCSFKDGLQVRFQVHIKVDHHSERCCSLWRQFSISQRSFVSSYLVFFVLIGFLRLTLGTSPTVDAVCVICGCAGVSDFMLRRLRLNWRNSLLICLLPSQRTNINNASSESTMANMGWKDTNLIR